MTIREFSALIGYHRDSISTRIKRFGLGDDWQPKDVIMLRPLDDTHASKRSLEDERAELARQQARVAKFKADELEGRLADVDELLARYAALLETIAATIKTSLLEDDRKEDIFTSLRDALKERGESFK